MTSPDDAPRVRQRIDKWLWHARFFRTRTLAAKAVETGRCRVNRERVHKPGSTVHPGDVLTFVQGPHIRVIEIVAMTERRGPAREAAVLYNDLDPPQPRGQRGVEEATGAPPRRDTGAGRPTKKERRDIERLRDRT